MSSASFTFDGTEIVFVAGQTVGAALVADGRPSWRTTRGNGAPRGLFCGIGVCFDCLVTVGARPNERACLVLAERGLAVTTQDGTGHVR
ncbi:(2Fe-2S)-binding protein [Knoellia sp. CPCC 206453]|uniref:(2Fe-2S)-binding protein n=1 Tax=Knoellia pratensis TaxID=3404796 RepID=UPI0036207A69